ncbi:MAG: dephospho-CoA kinase [Candidatus Latescibacterota bacterium]|jgi:dephospho-CoA kinase
MIIGVTGGMGSGKTSFSSMLAELGVASVVNADLIANRAVGKDVLLGKLIAAFGCDIATSEGELDRRALGRLALADKTSQDKLYAIIRPQLERDLRCELARAQSESDGGIVLFDAPLIYEWGIEDWVDAIVLVDCEEDMRIQRVLARSSLSLGEIQRRIALQMDSIDKEKRANFVIDNNGSVEDLRGQAEKLWRHWVGLLENKGEK